MIGDSQIPSALGQTITGALANIPFPFGIDSDGNYGYIKAGADSVVPFKSEFNWNLSALTRSTPPSSVQLTIDLDKTYVIIGMTLYNNTYYSEIHVLDKGVVIASSSAGSPGIFYLGISVNGNTLNVSTSGNRKIDVYRLN